MPIVFRLLFVVALLYTGRAAEQRDNTLLRYHVQHGDTYHYAMSMDNEIASPLLPTPIGSTLSSVFGVQATSTTDEQIGLEFSYDQLSIATTGAAAMGRQDTTIDIPTSEDTKLTVIIDRKGTLLFAWPSLSLVTAYQTGARLGNGGIQSAMRKLFFSYPDEALQQGTTWRVETADTTSPGEGKLVTQMNSTMTFEGITDTLGMACARIALHSDSLTMKGRSLYMNADMTVRGHGTATGMYYVELRSGMIVTHTMTTVIDMQLVMAQQKDNVIPMRTTSSVVVERRVAKK